MAAVNEREGEGAFVLNSFLILVVFTRCSGVTPDQNVVHIDLFCQQQLLFVCSSLTPVFLPSSTGSVWTSTTGRTGRTIQTKTCPTSIAFPRYGSTSTFLTL